MNYQSRLKVYAEIRDKLAFRENFAMSVLDQKGRLPNSYMEAARVDLEICKESRAGLDHLEQNDRIANGEE